MEHSEHPDSFFRLNASPEESLYRMPSRQLSAFYLLISRSLKALGGNEYEREEASQVADDFQYALMDMMIAHPTHAWSLAKGYIKSGFRHEVDLGMVMVAHLHLEQMTQGDFDTEQIISLWKEIISNHPPHSRHEVRKRMKEMLLDPLLFEIQEHSEKQFLNVPYVALIGVVEEIDSSDFLKDQP